MSPLDDALADYLNVRRALGYKLERAGKLLPQYLDHLDQRGEQLVTVENALAWATVPAGDTNWWAFRMSVVRGFASYLHALDPAHQVPREAEHEGRGSAALWQRWRAPRARCGCCGWSCFGPSELFPNMLATTGRGRPGHRTVESPAIPGDLHGGIPVATGPGLPYKQEVAGSSPVPPIGEDPVNPDL